MAIRVGINGFGRIGRTVLKAGLKDPEVEFVAVNDLTDAKTLAHLLKYDSIFGIADYDVSATEKEIIIRWKERNERGEERTIEKRIEVLSKKSPAELQSDWKRLDVGYVVESTGRFRDRGSAEGHLYPDTKNPYNKVVITAPAEDEDITIVMGVNDDKYNPWSHHIVSNASCTTNCLAPVAKVLLDRYKMRRGLMTTIHSYTNDQVILDFPHKDLRRARAAGLSMILTTTGAAKAIGKVLPALEGKMDGLAIRVPTPNVSLVDLVAELENPADKEGLADAYRKAATEGPLKPYLEYCEEPLVSRDFNGNPKSAIVDAEYTYIIPPEIIDNGITGYHAVSAFAAPRMTQDAGTLIKVLAWYDNEWAYSCRVNDLVKYMESRRG